MLEGYCWPAERPPRSIRRRPRLLVRSLRRRGRPRGSRARGRLAADADRGIGASDPRDRVVRRLRLAARARDPRGRGVASGYYSVRLTGAGEEADAFFVVRPAEAAPILLVLSTSTYHAYNDWGGRRSTRAGPTSPSTGPRPRVPPQARARPPEGPGGARPRSPRVLRVGRGARPLTVERRAGWWTWERPFVSWAEREGFAVDVAISQDLERHPEVLDGHRLFPPWATTSTGPGGCETRSSTSSRTGQRRVLRWQHVLVAGPLRRRRPRHDVLQVPGERGPGPRHARRAALTGAWPDPRIGRPEASMIGLVLSRRVFALRPRGAPGLGRLHGLAPGPLLGVRGVRAPLRRRPGNRRRDRRLRGRRLRADRGRPPVPTHADGAPEGPQVLATAPARLRPATSSRPGTRTSPASSSTSRWRCSATSGRTE